MEYKNRKLNWWNFTFALLFTGFGIGSLFKGQKMEFLLSIIIALLFAIVDVLNYGIADVLNKSRKLNK